MSNDESKRIPTWLIPNWLQVVFCIAIAVAVLLISLYFWKFSNGLAEKQDVWGQFGDYVGGILNPLFSLTALIALLYTIHLQSKELHESTEQLKASAEALALQNSVMARQQFETTFFQMLALFNEVIRGMERSDTKGRSCTRSLSKTLHSRLQDATKENINTQYRDDFYNDYGYLLGNYFLTLYSIIKFVDKSDLKNEDKKFYTNIVRTQLSEDERVLLFYNCSCLNDDVREKFLPMVQKYKLLEHLNPNLLANLTHRELLPF